MLRLLNRSTLAVVLTASFVVVPLRAQQSPLVGDAELDRAVTAKAADDASARATINHLLERQAVRDVAGRAGIEIADVEASVAMLSGDELAEIAAQAQQVDDSLTGGQSTVTVRTTTIIIGLLVLILIIVAS